ncbi:MAG: FHA domain-containing protein [Oscillospiraceae bacterium]|nr:FHA domain-containing protein [Oscillospiraceae bacterium]
MNLLRCANGHYFDADKYAECPHCSQMMRHDLTQTEAIEIEQPGKDSVTTTPPPEFPPQPPVSPVDPGDDFGPGKFDSDADVTVGYYSNLIGNEPVVGFLVCTKGEYFGDSFSLKSGRNFIGRARNMDVILDLDPAVSRERHAIVVYEPRARVFIAQAGDSHGMFYVNDKVVLTNEPLKAYDKLSIGNTELMFIPCCGPEFSWDDVKRDSGMIC